MLAELYLLLYFNYNYLIFNSTTPTYCYPMLE